ncbi:signal transduction histidine kinase [Metabacillus crassostreae]|uniref:HAMP domain-containing sensor histidine kinase n=1 Tax=Metabacillus crassostreae TaxID=929098 RepID=UPI001959F920|nr:HAMP domain-containing sensor histidine kinase [Metabacillus crassostreae]MBM7602265.1 signal transduction histidine kinase [Metabacillus crassostreae]
MKIKYWLMISFLIVMLLPIITLYLLYSSLSSYDEEQDFVEYMSVYNQTNHIEAKLQNPDLYTIQPREKYKSIDSLVSNKIKIVLYRYDGTILYSSIEDPSSTMMYQTNLNTLYQNLNEIQKKHKSYVIKKPTLQEGKIIGFYEITVAREQWVEGFNERSIFLFSVVGSFFLLLYITVVLLLNRKLNKPLSILQYQMSAFAKGKNIENSYPYRKDEIGDLFIHFDQMKKQIEETRLELDKQQKEKEFIVAALSHDLKTPLTVVQAYTEALYQDKTLTQEEKRDYKTILFDKLNYMRQMLDDLAIYAVLQSTQEKIELIHVEGQEFFEMLVSSYEEPCAKRNLHLHVQQEVEGNYKVNVKQMIRIVDNLMTNAIRHTENGKSIWLAVLSERTTIPNWVFSPFSKELDLWRQDGTLILVQNEGVEIPSDLLEIVFEPFKQVEGARGLGGSSGLGLSITKMLIEKHDGKIKLWSKEGYGTLVACWIKEG